MGPGFRFIFIVAIFIFAYIKAPQLFARGNWGTLFLGIIFIVVVYCWPYKK